MTAIPPFDAELLRRYDRPGPRYTSYPTAPQFRRILDIPFEQGRTTEAIYRRALAIWPQAHGLRYRLAANATHGTRHLVDDNRQLKTGQNRQSAVITVFVAHERPAKSKKE